MQPDSLNLLSQILNAFRLPLVRQNSEFIEFLLVSYGIRTLQVPVLVVALIMKRSFDHLVSDRFSPDGLI